jgi:hypothetical protein
VLYDGFSSLDGTSWTAKVGNGLDKGWDFWGFGLNEQQVIPCYIFLTLCYKFVDIVV